MKENKRDVFNIIITIDFILVLMYVLSNHYEAIYYYLALSKYSKLYSYLTYILLHGHIKHLLGNLLAFNIISLILLMNDIKLIDYIGVILLSALLGGIGFLITPRIFENSRLVGFSPCIIALIVYSTLFIRKNLLVQFILLLFTCYILFFDYLGLYNPLSMTAHSSHVFGAMGGLLYRILNGMIKDLYNRLNKILFLKRR